MPESLKDRNFSNILIIKPSSLGDVVRCLPILAALRQRYPQAHISWLVRPDCAAILTHIPELDEIIEFDRKKFGKMAASFSALRDFITFLRHLRRKKFDLILDLQGLFRSGFLAFASGAPIRIGFAHARELAPLFYTHRIKIPQEREHVVISNWRFMDYLGLGQLENRYPLPVDPAAAQSAQLIFRENGLPPDHPYIVMLIGGTEPRKRWPAKSFADLAQSIQIKYDIPSILLGAGSEELAIANQIIDLSKVKILNLVSRTSLQQLIAIVKKARLVVGNDSGPLHVAAAAEVPVIGLYGPTNPAVVGPYGHLSDVIQAGDSHPGTVRYSYEPQHRIENITVQQVLDKITQKLKAITEK